MQADSGGGARSACLTDEELALLQSAPPGRAPQALAHHLAGCDRCQQRALFGSEKRRPTKRRPPPEWPSRRRALLLLVAVLVTLAMLFYSLQRLAGPAR